MQNKIFDSSDYMNEDIMRNLEMEVFNNCSYFQNCNNIQLKLFREIYSIISNSKYKFYILLNIKKFLIFHSRDEHESILLEKLERELEHLILSTVQNFNDLYLYYTLNLLIVEIKLNEKLFNFAPYEFTYQSNDALQESDKEKILQCENILDDLDDLINHIKTTSVLLLKKSYSNMITFVNGKFYLIKTNYSPTQKSSF